MTHKYTAIEFEGKEGSWKVVYVPDEYGFPNASVFLNDVLYLKMGTNYERRLALNPTKTQAKSIITQARKIVKQNELASNNK